MTTAQRPAPTAPRPYHFPRFERRKLPNGLRLILAPVHKLPLVTLTLVIEAGASTDPAGKEGLARLAARSLSEGTQQRSGQELTDALERLGTSIESSTDWDAALVTMTVMSRRLREAMALFAEAVVAPAFPEREIARLRAERQTELLQLRAEPRGLADEMFARFLYSEGSRYAQPEGGTDVSVATLTADDVRAFHARRYRADAATLIVAGDVSADEAERLASNVFGTWRAGAEGRVTVSDEASRPTAATWIVAKTDAPQSEVRLGHVGLPRTHPEFIPVVVMNALLGGLFSSRINLNLRERHGYTYGAWSEFDWRRGRGPFVVSTAVRSDVTEAAVREILREVEGMRTAEVSTDELSLATNFLDGVFPIKYETTGAIARALANVVMYDLPDDYFDTYRDRVRAVTPARVLEVARAHVDPARAQLIVVGDPETIRAPLATLGLGPLTVVDADGSPRD